MRAYYNFGSHGRYRVGSSKGLIIYSSLADKPGVDNYFLILLKIKIIVTRHTTNVNPMVNTLALTSAYRHAGGIGFVIF